MPLCPHAHGEYSDDYQHCLDCGREVLLINGEWFEIEAWISVHEDLIGEPRPPAREKE